MTPRLSWPPPRGPHRRRRGRWPAARSRRPTALSTRGGPLADLAETSLRMPLFDHPVCQRRPGRQTGQAARDWTVHPAAARSRRRFHFRHARAAGGGLRPTTSAAPSADLGARSSERLDALGSELEQEAHQEDEKKGGPIHREDAGERRHPSIARGSRSHSIRLDRTDTGIEHKEVQIMMNRRRLIAILGGIAGGILHRLVARCSPNPQHRHRPGPLHRPAEPCPPGTVSLKEFYRTPPNSDRR